MDLFSICLPRLNTILIAGIHFWKSPSPTGCCANLSNWTAIPNHHQVIWAKITSMHLLLCIKISVSLLAHQAVNCGIPCKYVSRNTRVNITSLFLTTRVFEEAYHQVWKLPPSAPECFNTTRNLLSTTHSHTSKRYYRLSIYRGTIQHDTAHSTLSSKI